jgi:aminoglycoside 6'-N-acetyltransferase-1b
VISPQFHFRPLSEDDIPLLWEWLNRAHVARWWRGEPSMEEVHEKYVPRIAGIGSARPFVALLDGEAVGYIQYYVVLEGDPDWWPDEPRPGVVGIDQFVADGERLDRGLGTAMVSQFVELVTRERSVTEVRVDPHLDNARAIRCYEKAGFRRVRRITTPDGPALWMAYHPGGAS